MRENWNIIKKVKILLVELIYEGYFLYIKGVITINNPYTGLLNIMQEKGKKYNTPALYIGKVIQPQTLKIKIGELVLEQDDMLISSALIDSNNRSNNLKQGDLLALMPTENRQTYIVLCKVVKP